MQMELKSAEVGVGALLSFQSVCAASTGGHNEEGDEGVPEIATLAKIWKGL